MILPIKTQKDGDDELRLALNAARMGIWKWDIITDTITWSDNAHEIFGIVDEAFDGTFPAYQQLIHADDLPYLMSHINTTLTSLKDYYIEHRIVHSNGAIRWVEAIGKVICDEAGIAVQMRGTVRDITDKKNLELESQNWKIKFDLIANSTNIIIYDYNLLNGDIEWSQNIRATLGYEGLEINHVDKWIERIHPDDKKSALENLDRSQQKLKPYDVIYRFRKKNGDYCPIQDRGFFMTNETGNAIRMLGMMQDVSINTEAEKALQESEGRFKKLIHDLNTGVLIQGSKAEIILFNEAALSLLGLTGEELNGTTSFDPAWNVIHEDGSAFPGNLHPVPVAIATLTPVRDIIMGVYRPALKDRIWLLVNANPILDVAGNLVHVVCTFADITERKKIEHALKESEQRFRILQQASFGGIGLHNQGMLIDCNQGLSDITGYTHEELVGMNGLLLVAPEFRDETMDKIKSGYDKPYDVEGVKKDGTRYVLEIMGKNLPYNGMTIRVTEFRNVTDRKRAEESVMEQNSKLLAVTEDLKRKNEQLEEFTQIVSHNLRAPVGNILTLTGFLEGSETDKEKEEYIKLLKESGSTTLAMLNDLNDVLKIKQNKNIEKTDLRFEKVFQDVRNMLSAKITEASAEIICDFEKAPVLNYPGIYLESILLNLLSNSLKYFHHQRKPVIEFKTYLKNENIILEVRDNGLGINLEKYGHQVFKMRKTFHRHPESRGIGLFMIKNQIEVMGGDITIFSKQNEGTTFFINFNKYQN